MGIPFVVEVGAIEVAGHGLGEGSAFAVVGHSCHLCDVKVVEDHGTVEVVAPGIG